MASQAFLDKLGETRTAIQTMVAAIVSAYYNKDTVDEKLKQVQRFTRPASAATLSAPVRLIPDNATATCTYTLPATPVDGDVIEWRPSATPFTTNPMVFQRNGNTILDADDDLTVDTPGACGRLVWDGPASTWRLDSLGTAISL